MGGLKVELTRELRDAPLCVEWTLWTEHRAVGDETPHAGAPPNTGISRSRRGGLSISMGMALKIYKANSGSVLRLPTTTGKR